MLLFVRGVLQEGNTGSGSAGGTGRRQAISLRGQSCRLPVWRGAQALGGVQAIALAFAGLVRRSVFGQGGAFNFI